MSISTFLKMFKKLNQVEGSNAFTLPNGARYSGQTVNGIPQGKGTMTYANQEQYQGQFRSGMKHGKGKYFYHKGQLYIGDWYQNKKHGKGQYFYPNQTSYVGDFYNNMKHGHGKLQQINGSYYEGTFKENNKDNTGVFYNVNTNKKYLQTYDHGRLISQFELKEDINKQDNQDSNDYQQQLQIPQLLIKKTTKTKNPSQLERQYVSDKQKCQNGSSQSEEIIKQNIKSQCQRMIPSLRQLSSRLRTEQNPTLIAENYFSQSLLGKRINQWTIEQTSSWLNQIGFGDCIEQFRKNKIQGDSLLVLQNEDFKQLGIGALGDRRIISRQIQFIRLIFKSQCLGDSISKLYQQQVTLQLVRELQAKKQRKQLQKQKMFNVFTNQQSSSSSQSQKQIPMQVTKKSSSSNSLNVKKASIQSKVQKYLQTKGIKLTFLIPKEQIDIIRQIGQGGYGQVYEGRWLGQPVAVKKYMKKQGLRNRHIGHFIEQVQVINKLLHPSIVLYMGMCIYDNEYGMITEFLSGGSLFDYLHKSHRKLTEERLFYICKDVALGMSYLHGKNVLHCDLKSSNVLIDERWNVKLCDFGLSRIHTTKKKKKTYMRVGTPHWMAPEILKGEKYEYESDVYSFGILLWQMLTGQIPYKNLSTAQIIGQVGNNQNHQIPMPKTSNQLFLSIFISCTNRNPKKRPSFKTIVQALEKQQYKYVSDESVKII